MLTPEALELMWSKVWNTIFHSFPELYSMPHLCFVKRYLVYQKRYDSRNPGLLNDPFFKYTLSGSGLLHTDTGTVKLTRNKGFLFSPKRTDCSFELPEGASEPWEWLHISFAGVDDLILEMIDAYGFVFEMERNDPLLSPFWQFRQSSKIEYSITIPAHESAMLVTSFLANLAQRQESQSSIPRSRKLTQRVKEQIRSRLYMRPRMADVAAAMRVSPEHLNRIFKAETGITPLQFYHRALVSLACSLLGNPTLSVKEVAAKLSFKSSSHFVSFFRERVGVSPAVYRSHADS